MAGDGRDRDSEVSPEKLPFGNATRPRPVKTGTLTDRLTGSFFEWRARKTGGSDLSVLGDLQCVIDLDVEVSHPQLQLGMAKHGAHVLGAAVNQRRLGSPHRMRAVLSGIKTKFLGPAFENPGVLACAQMW